MPREAKVGRKIWEVNVKKPLQQNVLDCPGGPGVCFNPELMESFLWVPLGWIVLGDPSFNDPFCDINSNPTLELVFNYCVRNRISKGMIYPVR